MTQTQQGKRHSSARASISQESTHDDDLHAFFRATATIPAGATYNEAFILWLQGVTGSPSDNINDLAQTFAESSGAYNWSSTGGLAQATGPFADTTAITADTTAFTADSF